MKEDTLKKAAKNLKNHHRLINSWTIFDRKGEGPFLWMGTGPRSLYIDQSTTFEVIDISQVSSVYELAPAMVFHFNNGGATAYVPNVNWNDLSAD